MSDIDSLWILIQFASALVKTDPYFFSEALNWRLIQNRFLCKVFGHKLLFPSRILLL